jgi:hypothetical protein
MRGGDDLVASAHQVGDEVGANEAARAGDQDSPRPTIPTDSASRSHGV